MTARSHRFRAGIARCALACALVCAPAPLSASGAPPTASSAQGETGRVVIGFEPGAAPRAQAAAERAGATPRHRSDAARFVVVTPRSGESPAQLSRRLAGTSGVRYAEPERTVRALFTPNDTNYSSQWNFAAVGAPAAWDIERGDAGVTVAVIDSGVDLQHPDLAGRLDTLRDYDFVANDTVADDDFGHGTHVAGIVAASTNNSRDVAGLAHGCTILPIRVLDAHGTGDDTDVAEGIHLAVNRGADVINLSLGMLSSSRVLEDAIEYAVSRDVVVVAAAGNGGGAGLDYPAAYPDVIAVGATDSRGARSMISQYGDELDLMAPGVNVLSLRPVTGPAADGPVGRLTGTSVGTPHVAAIAALLRSANPTWTAAVVADRLSSTAEDLGAAGKDDWYGHGLVRADLALDTGVLPASPPSDDALPGMPLSTSPARGSVDSSADPRDIMAVALSQGHRLRVSFTGSPGATLSVGVFEPGVDPLVGGAVASAVSTGSAISFEYAVPYGMAGTYSIAVSADAGGGDYSLSWLRGYPTSVSVTVPSTIPWGTRTYLQGRVWARGEALPKVRVVVDARSQVSSQWIRGVVTRSTTAEGTFRIAVRPSRRMSYRVRFEGIPGELGSVSRAVNVSPKAALSAPTPTSAVRADTVFYVAGTLRPEHPVAEQTVKIAAWVWDENSGSWALYEELPAVNQDRDGFTRYVRRLILPKGRWRIVASVPGDYWHAAAFASTYLTVR